MRHVSANPTLPLSNLLIEKRLKPSTPFIPENTCIEEVSAEDSASMGSKTEKYYISNNYSSNEGDKYIFLKEELLKRNNKIILSNITNLPYSENNTQIPMGDENKYKICTDEYEKLSSNKHCRTTLNHNNYQVDSPELALEKQQAEKFSKSIENLQKLARVNYDTNDENSRANNNFNKGKSISEIDNIVSARFTDKAGSMVNKELTNSIYQNNAKSTSNLLHIDRSASNLALNSNGISAYYADNGKEHNPKSNMKEETRSLTKAIIADHYVMETTEPKKGIGFEKQSDKDKCYSKKGSITTHTSRRGSIMIENEGIPSLSLKERNRDEKINSLTVEILNLSNKMHELELENAHLRKENNRLKFLDDGCKFEKKRSTTDIHGGDKTEYIKILKIQNEKFDEQNYELKKINKELEEKLHSSKNDLLNNSKYYEDIIEKLKIELDKLKVNSSSLFSIDEKSPQEKFNFQTEEFLSYTLDNKRPIEQSTIDLPGLIKELQFYQKNTQKFIDSITKMVMECSPTSDNKPPNLKQIWKWLKHVFHDYMELKTEFKSAPSLKEKDTLEQIKEFLFVTNKDDIIPAISDILVQSTRLSQLISKFKILLDLTHAKNIEELEEILDRQLKKKM